MTYGQRRVCRHRIMRRTIMENKIKDAIASIKEFIPELIAAMAIMAFLFYVLPLFFGTLAATIK